jgi:hypothetical protein
MQDRLCGSFIPRRDDFFLLENSCPTGIKSKLPQLSLLEPERGLLAAGHANGLVESG